MKKSFISELVIPAVFLLICIVVGCVFARRAAAPQQGAMTNEIFTNKEVDQNKTMITLRVEYEVEENDILEKTLEEEFPNVDIVLRHDGATNAVYSLKQNLAAGTENDLIISNAIPYLSDEEKEQYLLEFSGESFPGNYYMNAIDSCTDDAGNVYYLPGPSNVYGIVYDKTMFDEYGWEVPESYSEFVQLLDTIRKDTKKAGEEITPIQVSLMYPDVFQILYNTFGFDEVYRGEDNFQWLSQYQKGVGSMVGHMESAVKSYRRLFSDGILSLEDVNMQPRTRSEMMYVEHSTAMIVECQNAVDYVESMTQGTDAQVHDIAMMPFWTSDEKDSDYLYAIPEYYLAINRQAAEENDEKKAILIDIMDYLSSKEGQKVLMGDDFVLSNVQNVPMISNTFSEGIMDTIERGQIINTFSLAAGEDDKQVESKMLELTPKLIQGKITTKQFLKAADKARDEWLSQETDETAYGEAEATLTRLETAYTVAQMYADVMDAQIGLCLGGGWNRSTNGQIYQGKITDTALDCISPDKEHTVTQDNPDGDSIVSAELTGEQILSVLNNTSSLGEKQERNCYYVAAGLTVEYAPWAVKGSRVLSCKTADGKEIKEDKVYTVAYFNGSLALEDLEPKKVSSQTWKDDFVSWLRDKGGKIKIPDMTITLVYDR